MCFDLEVSVMRVLMRICVATCLVAGLFVSPGWAQTTPANEVKVHDPADLEIEKVAPDIEGVDLDSVPFKLSDYRGKVVVLDFWGDW
jgi:cytochrome oxidase Cu insertion factor (SCO1/SenC/PrrC family)